MIRTIRIEVQKIPAWLYDTLLVLGSSILLGLFAHMSFHLGFTPVPIATQGSLILLLGVLLGSKRAPLAVMAFLTQAAMGLPVLAGGSAGLARFVGPSAGYLLGYLVAAYVVGKLVEMLKERTLLNAFWCMAAGNVLLFVFGILWLSTFVGWAKVFWLGVAPFLIGDFLKLMACVKILQWMGWAKSSIYTEVNSKIG